VRYLPNKLPNTFTPNGDGVNDYSTIEVKGLTHFQNRGLQRKGRVGFCFSGNRLPLGWTENGWNPAPDGRYVYQVELKMRMESRLSHGFKACKLMRR
jgi:hypothetical protein